MSQDNTYRTSYARLFRIEDLPQPLTRASPHVQFHDNYLAGTELRLRTVRTPETNEWLRILQKRTYDDGSTIRAFRSQEMSLAANEYALLERYEGREIRKNRHRELIDGTDYDLDVYIGPLWGLNVAILRGQDPQQLAHLAPPSFAVMEVSDDPFFRSENLVGKDINDVRVHLDSRAAKA